MNFEELLQQIKHFGSERVTVVAVCGFGGSGKSTLSNKLSEALDKSIVIGVDDFIDGGLRQRGSDWDGIDWKYFAESILIPLKRNEKTLSFFPYNWDSGKKEEQSKEVVVTDVVIIEGIGLLRQEYIGYFDMSIWIDCPIDVAVERGRIRDRDEYNVTEEHLKNWDDVWMPNDKEYFEKHRPDMLADIIYPYET